MFKLFFISCLFLSILSFSSKAEESKEELYSMVCPLKDGNMLTFSGSEYMIRALHKKLLEKYYDEYKLCVIKKTNQSVPKN